MDRWTSVMLGVCLTSLLYVVAVAVRLAFLHALPYGDEGMHYFLACHLLRAPTNLSDPEGLTWFHPSWIVWERPLFMVLLHPFAVHGFTAFRVGNILITSFLPVSAWIVVRAFRGHVLTATIAGLACAVLPAIAEWGALGFMDEWMAIFLALGLAARQRGHHWLAGSSFLLAIWAKETAWAAVLAVAAVSFFAAWWNGQARLMPFSADGPTTPLLWALVLGPVPLVLSLMTGLNQFGGAGHGYAGRLADVLTVSPWFLPALCLGLRWRESRTPCAFALFLAGAYLASHALAGRSVEAWYTVAPMAFSLIGVALTIEQAIRRAATKLGKSLAVGCSVAAILLLAVIVLAPAGAAKGQWTHPVTGQADPSLAGAVRFETVDRDRPLRDALAAMHLDATHDVVVVDVGYGNALAMTDSARHVWIDSAVVRDSFPLRTDRLVQRLETNGTWLLVQRTDSAMYHAYNEAYADCRVFEEGDLRLYAAWQCPGRQDVLDRGYASRHR